jgi:hypothetical protein
MAHNNRWTAFWYLASRRVLNPDGRGWWSGMVEATVASVLILFGVALLVATLTANILSPVHTDFYSWILNYCLQPVLAIAMTAIGGLMVVKALWNVGSSAERRGAFVSRANQLELVNEIRRRRGDLPSVPSQNNGPVKGTHLNFRVLPSRQGLWGLATAGVLSLSFVVIVAVLLVTAYAKWSMGRTDWVAGLLVIPIFVATGWSFYRFVKQLLKTTSVGPTVVELQRYPVVPGVANRIFLSQSGRFRLKLLEVRLACIEEATFNQGTNTMTERLCVYSRRLFRKRGIALGSKNPFRTSFEFSLPAGAMHSFQTSSNRITWQIEIHLKTKGLPQVTKNFEIIVIPVLGLRPAQAAEVLTRSS